MIGLDTNVLARYIVQDDAEQAAEATALIEGFTEEEPGYVGVVTVVELYWVLTGAYGVDHDVCCDLLTMLIDAREIRVGSVEVVRLALAAAANGAGFADAIIAELGRAAGCEDTVTFDRQASRRAGMRLLSGSDAAG